MAQVPAARNVLRMLRMLAGRTAPVAAATLARELGIPRSSLYQLARTMMDEGFLVHYPEERAYGLSALVVEIGSASLATERLGRMSQPLMERLIQGLPVPTVAHLAVLTGAEVTYVTRVSAPRAPTTVSNVGVRLPAHLTATGRAMLAQLPAAQVRALYPHRETLIRRQGPGPATLDELSALLAASRDRGWALEDGDVTSGYSSVGAAALDHKGYPAAAIGVTFRSGIPAEVATDLGRAVAVAAASLSARITGH
ncbi:IclR family transcriptional regulator [Salinibacterium sp.]|uniref:IclR family transcriptional regulator n=1 Tax=Salinibacterium sp. TaxID=1915057 RepID=UPI00286D09D8|nr:IclR family transcriptional regulator [Salinibacterium sp.]